MRILVLSPKPAKRSEPGNVIIEHQVQCLLSAVNNFLADAECDSISSDYIKLNPSDGSITDCIISPEKLSNADLIVQISGKIRINKCDTRYGNRAIYISPAYPGSSAQNEILIQPALTSTESDHIRVRIVNRDIPTASQTTNFASPELHYSRFKPLLKETGAFAYQRRSDHVIALITYDSSATFESDLQADTRHLASLVQRFTQIKRMTLVIDTTAAPGVSKHQKQSLFANLTHFVNVSLGLPASIIPFDSLNYAELYALMTKSKLAIFAGNTVYPDALRLGIPVYLWRDARNSASALNACWDSIPLNENPRASIENIALQQQSEFEKLHQGNLQGLTTISNEVRAFNRRLACTLSGSLIEIDSSFNLPDDTMASTGPVITPITRSYSPFAWKKIRHGAIRNHRKLIKLNKSPARFIKDSDNAAIKLLRPLIR